MFTYQPGDVMVQRLGAPWPLLARIATGYPYPHAQLVSRVEGGTVYVVEDHGDNDGFDIHEHAAWSPEWFIIARPRTDSATKAGAIAYMREHIGEVYGLAHLVEVALLARTGLLQRPDGYDDDVTEDRRPKICSEAIARAFLRAGRLTGSHFDLVPQICDYDTLPYHILYGGQCDLFLPDGTPFDLPKR